MISLAHQLGVDRVEFVRPTMFETREHSTLVDDVPKGDLLNALVEGSNIAKNFGIRTNLGGWIENFEKLWRFFENKQLTFKPSRCIRPWFSPYVAVDGKVYSCFFLESSALHLVT